MEASKQTNKTASITIKIVPGKWVIVTEMQRVGTDATNLHRWYYSLYYVKNLDFTYPTSQSRQYAPILAHILSSFDPGRYK